MENMKKETISEYKIGHTTYVVTTMFNPDFSENFSDILKRLIIRECESFIGENKQERELQAV